MEFEENGLSTNIEHYVEGLKTTRIKREINNLKKLMKKAEDEKDNQTADFLFIQIFELQKILKKL